VTRAHGVVDGARDTLPVAIALLLIGLAWGYLAHSVGLPWWIAVMMSAVVYAGPAQFLAAPLIAIGAGVPAIVATTFVANLRYALFAATLVPLLRDAPPARLVPLAHILADGSFAVTLRHAAEHPGARRLDRYLLGSSIVSFATYVPATLAGALLGSSLPPLLAYGFGFASPGIFIGFLVPLIRDRVAAAVAALSGATTILGNTYLPTGSGPVLAIVGASVVGGTIRWRRGLLSS
jgi:4-azaleucine resistance transporter AzlC